jgi:hypothetical protein
MGHGKLSLRESTLVRKRCLKCSGNYGIHTFGLAWATKKFIFRYGTFSIKDGSQIRFWEDSWLGNNPLCEQYPVVYSIVRRKIDTIVVVMATSPPDVTFRRDLIGPRLQSWNALLQCLDSIQRSAGTDDFRWNLHPNGKFCGFAIQSDHSVRYSNE